MVKWSWVRLGAPHTSTETLLPTLPMESGNPTFFRSLSCKPARWRSSFRLFSKKPSPSRISIRKIWPEHNLTYLYWVLNGWCTHAHTHNHGHSMNWQSMDETLSQQMLMACIIIMATTQIDILYSKNTSWQNVPMPWHVGHEVGKFRVGSPCRKQCGAIWNGKHTVEKIFELQKCLECKLETLHLSKYSTVA